MRQTLKSILVLAALLLPMIAASQPVPVEGTEMIPNEYGSEFPKEIVWKKDGSRMILVPYGTFQQGLDEAKGGTPEEGPEREVYLPSFYIDVTEVTNYQYNEFRKDAPAPMSRTTGNPALIEPNRPVSGIPWNAASGYAEWSGRQLPTEAMWEKAARGPKNTLYTTGAEPPSPEKAVYGRGPVGLTVPVNEDTGDVSGYGVMHMAGNVAEWCRDYYSRNAYEEGNATNPTGPSYGESKVVRGGSFASKEDEIRTTHRIAMPRTQIRDEVGFRTVWVPKPIEKEKFTPTPSPVPILTAEESVARLKEKIIPFLEKGDLRLPPELMANRAFMNKGFDDVQFVNFTPFRLSLTFIGPDHEAVFKYNEPLPPMSFRLIQLPREVDLYILGYTDDAGSEQKLLNLGPVRAESKATVVIRTELFTPVVTSEGEEIPVSKDSSAEQFYDSFSPSWNVMEVFNPLDMPLKLSVDDVWLSTKNPERYGEFTVAPGDVLRLELPPGKYSFRVNYFGAMDESGEPVVVTIDDSASRRLLNIGEDKNRSGGVTVITQELPYLRLSLMEARRPLVSSKN